MNEVYAFIEAEKTTHPVAFLCQLLKVARSSFYAWQAAAKARAAREAADDASLTRSPCSTSPRKAPTVPRASTPNCGAWASG
ncbi:hypothetical protein [Streptomyces halobius]|uniref:Transposase n=1 Tax=Streptomyces halobius TaxID=2879846 RepID=A0ABY4MP03_9ACTN|nr:hypothetical protein [Streptomyces halobius]UQA98185.1 hypothetical protein K9S39_10210 [Streptomyces halobius]